MKIKYLILLFAISSTYLNGLARDAALRYGAGFTETEPSFKIKTILTSTDYKLQPSDTNTMLTFATPSNSTVKVVVPQEHRNKNIFLAGTRIYGTALTDGVIAIVGETNKVEIINPDFAFRTRKMGSQFSLIRLSKNMWALNGDLYSLQVDAYVGDEIILKANVDPAAASPLYFVWYKQDVPIEGATNASLKLTNIQQSDEGNYTVQVNNDFGYSNSETTTIFVR